MSDPPVLSARSSDVLPRRAPRLVGVVLDGEEVVYDPSRREAHLLNPTASLLLRRCDGQTTVADLIEELVEAYGADPAVVAADLATALDDFARRQLVGPEPSPADLPEVGRPMPELVARPDPVVSPDRWAVESATLVALRSRLRVRSDEPVVGRYVDQVFASLISSELVGEPAREPVGDPVHTYDIVTGGAGPIRLLLDGTEVGATNTLDGAMSYLQWSINQLAIGEAGAMALLHAAAVRLGDRVAMFPAESNSGKSTLAAGMVRAGLGYVTDEAVAIDPATGEVLAYPKPISLDRGSWDLFRDAEPTIADTDEPFFENEWHIDPRRLHPDALDPDGADGRHHPRVVLVAFPSYVAGAATELTPMGRAEGLLLLLQNSFDLSSHGPSGLAALVQIAETAQLARFTVGDLGEAVDLIRMAL